MTGQWFSLGTPVSSPNKIDRHDIIETLMKVTLKYHKQNKTKPIYYLFAPILRNFVNNCHGDLSGTVIPTCISIFTFISTFLAYD